MSQVKDCNITFHSLGETDRSAMPLGNGECAASVWTEQNGDICLYAHVSLFNPDNFRTIIEDRLHAMRDHKDGGAAVDQFFDPCETLFPEEFISHR